MRYSPTDPTSNDKEELHVNSLGDVFLAMIYFYFIVMIFWIFIQVFADIFRRNDLSGAWKVIWILVIFIVPFFGALVYIVTRPKMTEQDQQLMAEAQAKEQRAAGYSSADEVAKLAALRDSGAITPAEFEAQKAKALA
jgi:flagellar biosynthesis/type III secretory pathway M-ring protein FliF/YscJ